MNRIGARNTPFFAAAVAGMAAALICLVVAPRLWFAAGADTFFVVFLCWTAIRVPRLTPDFLRRHAGGADEPAWIIFSVTVVTAFVALSSLIVLVNKAGSPGVAAFALGLASVPLGWFTIHMMASLHYAHLFWVEDDEGEDKWLRGLDFPDTKEPAGWDFLYFGFTIGMTAQTSDTQVTSTEMRRFVLGHSIVAFFFNTVLLAATINVVIQH